MEFTRADVRQKFVELYKTEPLLVRSPARINLIGEHTDYNEGFVMPAAIDKEIVFAIAPATDNRTNIFSLNFNEEVEVNIDQPDKVVSPRWLNYLLGVLQGVRDKNKNTKAFKCVFGGNIPPGAGVSSSAALECGFAFALNELNQFDLPKIEMIKIAQWAEHNYAGVKCGIMDQFASMMGKKDHVFVLDCRSLAYQYFPIVLKGYTLLLLDTGVKHSLADSEYNTRRKECEEGVSLLQKHYPSLTSLRDAAPAMILKHKAEFADVIYDRCFYVVSENKRVHEASKDLADHNIVAFGAKMYETHHGLSVLYDVSCKELDFLVDEAAKTQEVVGARMMGGGFGGCTINIILNDHVDTFTEQIKKSYRNRFNIELKSYLVKVNDGSSLILEG
jgi:galactokinase